jgi:hypothetical protein
MCVTGAIAAIRSSLANLGKPTFLEQFTPLGPFAGLYPGGNLFLTKGVQSATGRRWAKPTFWSRIALDVICTGAGRARELGHPPARSFRGTRFKRFDSRTV